MMVQLPASVSRIPAHTAEHINRDIRRQTLGSIAHYVANPAAIDRRLQELDQEWDIERVLETICLEPGPHRPGFGNLRG